jgi:hypothetical protein
MIMIGGMAAVNELVSREAKIWGIFRYQQVLSNGLIQQKKLGSAVHFRAPYKQF